ncbi:MAG: TetR/AcrR family transcriptional regulator [Spirochaetes bacterium]|nr:TetR/AcrR family transcriptional regulator [Spirochaetota bacterium]
MQNIKSKYITQDGTLDESVIGIEFRDGLAAIKSSSGYSPDNKAGSQQVVDSYILQYLEKVSNDLNSNNSAKLIPNLLTIILQNAKSSGIKNINLNTDVITKIISLFKSEDRPAKKNKSKDKRKIVLDAAMIVFSRNGFHETHVDQIADFAGVAKGTVYRYFKSKEDILKEIIKANNELLTKELTLIFNKDGHILELIKEAIAYYVEFFDSNKDLYKILTHSPWILKDISDHFYKNIISHLNVVRRRVFNLTREGIVKPTDFYTVFYGIFGFIDGVIQKWFRRNCEYSLKDELPVIIEVLYYGFVSEGERKNIFI